MVSVWTQQKLNVCQLINYLRFSSILLFLYSQRKSRTWRNSSRSWEESNNTCQKPKKSSLKTTRRATPPSSSWELQSTSSHSKLMIRRKLRKSWTPSQLVSAVSLIYWLIFRHLDLKKEQLKWTFIRSSRWAVKEQQYAYWEKLPNESAQHWGNLSLVTTVNA